MSPLAGAAAPAPAQTTAAPTADVPKDVPALFAQLKISKYVQGFIDEDVDIPLLMTLDMNELEELGVTSSLHRKKIMRWIQDQKEDTPKLYVAPTAAPAAAAAPSPAKAKSKAGKKASGDDLQWGPAGCPICTHSFDFRLGEGRYNKNTPDSKEVKDRCSDLYARLHGDAKLVDTGMFLNGTGYAEIDQVSEHVKGVNLNSPSSEY